MPNPYVNKVVQSNGTTLIDISDTTAVASDVASGKYFYLASGEKVEGSGAGGIETLTILPEQSVTATSPDSSGYHANISVAESLIDGENYIVTMDGNTYLCYAHNKYDGADIYMGDDNNIWGAPSSAQYPFLVATFGNGVTVWGVPDTSAHTVKIERVVSMSGGTNQDYEDALTAFGVQSNLASGITALTTYANEITGESDTNLSDAVRSLADGYGQGGSSTPPWVSSVETVTIGANSVTNTDGVKNYFGGKTPYFAVVLKSAPTTNNQIVAIVNNAASALRYRSGAVGTAAISTAYDATLIEGTQYDIYHF